MEEAINIIYALALFSAIVTVVFILAKYSYLIKKSMLDKGIVNNSTKSKFPYLDLGCIVLGLGLGLLISSIFTTMDLSEDTMDLLVWGTILIFGALGLMVAHYLRKKIG